MKKRYIVSAITPSLLILWFNIITLTANQLAIAAPTNKLDDSTNYTKQISGKVVYNVGDRNYTHLLIKDAMGSYIIGEKDIEQISPNNFFSLFLLQDGWVRLGFSKKGRMIFINEKEYLLNKLIKVAEQRYVLLALRDYYEGGDEYYDVDLRNINSPVIKKIDLATAQRLGESGRDR